MGKVIAIAGNIGSGKTYLATLISEKLNLKLQLEDAMENPYIKDFYEDIPRWSFNMQVYYLKARFQQILKSKQSQNHIIQDRTIYEDVYVFAPVLYSMGLISDRDFNTYKELFSLIDDLVPPPDLLVYIRSSVPNLLKQIEQRNRPFERGISRDYLQRLNERYEVWMQNCSLNYMIIDVEETNFIEKKSHLKSFLDKIKTSIKE